MIPVHLPPLRERGEDIGMLAEHFVGRFAKQMGKRVTGISRVALEFVEAHSWPGNIRELENAMERAVALEQTPTVLPDSLPDRVRFGDRLPLALVSPVASALDLPDSGFVLEHHVARIERDYIAEALRRCSGVRTKAADLLGMTFRSFRYYAKKYESVGIGGTMCPPRANAVSARSSACVVQPTVRRRGPGRPAPAQPPRGALAAVGLAALVRTPCRFVSTSIDSICRPRRRFERRPGGEVGRQTERAGIPDIVARER